MPAHHMAQVHLGGFVFGHIKNLIALALQLRHQFQPIFFGLHANAHIDVRLICIGAAVVKFGDSTLAQGLAEPQKTALGLVDGYRKNSFAGFPDFGTFRNMAQTIKVHIGATDDGHHMGHVGIGLHIPLHARYRQRTGGLRHTARIFKNVFDRGTNFIHVDHHHIIDVTLGHFERLFANLGYADAIGEQIEGFNGQANPAPSFHRGV